MCPPGPSCWYRSTDQNLSSSHLCPLGLWGVEAGVSTGPHRRPPGAFEKPGGVGVAGVSCGPGRCSGQTAWSLVRWLRGLFLTRDPVGSHQTHSSWTRGNLRVSCGPGCRVSGEGWCRWTGGSVAGSRMFGLSAGLPWGARVRPDSARACPSPSRARDAGRARAVAEV